MEHLEHTDFEEEFDTRLFHHEKSVNKYFAHLDESELETADFFADSLKSAEKPLARTVVIIPVAAHQEKDGVAHAIDQYALQQTSQPFTLVLGLNAPFGADSDMINECISNIETAARKHPHLDLRTTYMDYMEPTIGLIRRDLWNGVLRLAQKEELLIGADEVIGINHDIDVMKLPSHYIAAVQKTMKGQRSASPAHTQIRHAVDEQFPHLSTVVRWIDYVYSHAESGYEAGAVIPLSFYAYEGGFDPSRSTNEINSFINDKARKTLIRTGFLETSPRRYIARLKNHGVTQIWTPETFGSNDSCRDSEYVSSLSDINRDEVVETITTFTTSHFDWFVSSAGSETFLSWRIDKILANEEVTTEEKSEKLASIFRVRRALITRALGACIGMPELARTIETELFSDERIETLTKASSA